MGSLNLAAGDSATAHRQSLTANTIRVCRNQDDRGADQVRIRVWAPPVASDFDSTWTVITPGHTIIFSHNLGITNTDLTVGLWFSGAARGIHQLLAGGDHDWFVGWQGVHLQNLTENTVRAVRRQDDQICPQVRIRIWRRSTQVYLPLVLR